jgi:excisionase family DNA binding protein
MTNRPPQDISALALMTTSQARQYLGGVSPQTLYRLINEEGLPLVKIRRRTFFRRSDLDALVRASTRAERR